MRGLLRIEAAKHRIAHIYVRQEGLESLQEAAHYATIHYSTMIEGNILSLMHVEYIIKNGNHFPESESDELEIKGLHHALRHAEKWAARRSTITENMIKQIHALVMSGGNLHIGPTPYRNGQNVIRERLSGKTIYMPPEAKDVPELMKELVAWINHASKEIPCAIVASIAHYQYATIHPYYDGNGRTARVLTRLILHAGGYDFKNLYSLEEYYVYHLIMYYQAIGIDETKKYYASRPQADITPWIEYFVEGMAVACEKAVQQITEKSKRTFIIRDIALHNLDPRQRKSLELFQEYNTITARQVGELFGFKPRTSAQLCHTWVEQGFLEIANASNKGRTYRLAPMYKKLII